MGSFKFKSLKVVDDIKDKIDEVELLESEDASDDEIKAWVEKFIVPTLEAIEGEEIAVNIDETTGELTIEGVEEEKVTDSIKSLAIKSKNFRVSMRKILDDDQYGSEYDTEEIPIEPIEEIIPEENTAEWLEEYAAPSIEAFLKEHDVDVVVTVSEEGEIRIKPENLEDLEKVSEIMDSFKHPKLTKSKLKVKDDEEESEPEGSEEIDVDPKEWAEEVALPAIEAYLEEAGYGTEATVSVKEDGAIVISVDADDKDVEEGKDLEEVTDSFLSTFTIPKGAKARLRIKRVSDSKRIHKFLKFKAIK